MLSETFFHVCSLIPISYSLSPPPPHNGPFFFSDLDSLSMCQTFTYPSPALTPPPKFFPLFLQIWIRCRKLSSQPPPPPPPPSLHFFQIWILCQKQNSLTPPPFPIKKSNLDSFPNQTNSLTPIPAYRPAPPPPPTKSDYESLSKAFICSRSCSTPPPPPPPPPPKKKKKKKKIF